MVQAYLVFCVRAHFISWMGLLKLVGEPRSLSELGGRRQKVSCPYLGSAILLRRQRYGSIADHSRSPGNGVTAKLSGVL